MSLVPNVADFQNTRPVWLLDLEWGGETWRVATEPVEVVTSGGRRLSYLGGMSAPTRLKDTLGRLKTDPGSSSATVAVVLPINVGQRVMQGHSLLLAEATIYLGTIPRQSDPYAVPTLNQQDHQLWHQLVGRVLQPRWGGKGDPQGYLEFQVKEAPWNDDSNTLIPSAAALTEDTLTGSLGLIPGNTVIPLVFGKPGKTNVPGSPCYLAGQEEAYNTIISPYMACNILPSRATSATMRYRTDSNSYSETTQNITRLNLDNGFPATVIASFLSSNNTPGTTKNPAWVIWDGDAGASASPYSKDDLRDSAEVAAYCLEAAGFEVDVPRWLGVKGRGSFNVDTYINDPDTTAWDWLDGSKLFEQMALTIRRGSGGIYPVPYSPDIYATRALASVREGDDWAAVSRVEMFSDLEDIVNSASVQFARSAETERATESNSIASVLGLDGLTEKVQRIATQAATANYVIDSSHATATSRARYGGRSTSIEIETFDATSAEGVALRMLSLSSLPTFTRSYRAPWFWGYLNVGDAIKVTDADASWTDVVAIINEKVWTGAGWLFEVLVDEILIRDSRPY